MQTAIDLGLLVLNWMQNLPREEMPPEYLWDDVEGLEQWWEQVQYRREVASPGDGPEPDLVENELARELKRGS